MLILALNIIKWPEFQTLQAHPLSLVCARARKIIPTNICYTKIGIEDDSIFIK
jgi:hypothetical protein